MIKKEMLSPDLGLVQFLFKRLKEFTVLVSLSVGGMGLFLWHFTQK